MSAAIRALVLCLVGLASQSGAQDMSAPQQINRWQDLGPYIAAQTEKINEHTANIRVLRSDLLQVIDRYDILLRAILMNVCASNKVLVENEWAAKLVGLEPMPVGNHDCAEHTGRWYVPGYMGIDGPRIPPDPDAPTQ